MSDPFDVPSGIVPGNSNMRPGAPANTQQSQSHNMMRPQVQQYINRPSPSYQTPLNHQLSGQFQRSHTSYQHSMQSVTQMAGGSPHQTNINHKQVQQPSSQHHVMLSSHSNLSHFNTLSQGSPHNSQQLNSQIGGSPYQMTQGSPAGSVPRFNSSQMPVQQTNSQSLQTMQMQQPVSSIQHQQASYNQQQLQQSRYQQIHPQQPNNSMQIQQKIQPASSPYQSQKSVQTPSQHSFGVQQNQQLQQPSQYRYQNQQQTFQNSPSEQYQQSPRSQQQFSSHTPNQNMKFAIPVPSEHIETVTQHHQPASVTSSMEIVPVKSSITKECPKIHVPVITFRALDPRQNLLMKPKSSVLKREAKDGKNSKRLRLKKTVRWAPALPFYRPPKFIRRKLKTRYLSPLSPPLSINGDEAEIASSLIQPLYCGELVIGKRKRKGMPTIRARLIGGKIVKPLTRFLSNIYIPKGHSPLQCTLRRITNERSLGYHQQIEIGDKLLINKRNTVSLNDFTPPEYFASSSYLKENPQNSLFAAKFQLKQQPLPFRRTFFHLPLKLQLKEKKQNIKPKANCLTEEEKKEREKTIIVLNNIPWRTIPIKSKTSILPRIWHPPILINQGWTVLPKNHFLCRPIPAWHPPLVWPPKALSQKRKKVFKIDGKISLMFHSSNETIMKKAMECDSNMEKTIHFAMPLVKAIIEPNNEIDVNKVVFNSNYIPQKSSLSSKKYTEPLLQEDYENSAIQVKRKNDNNRAQSKSPPLIKKQYEKPLFRIPLLQPPPFPSKEPLDHEISVDLTKNPYHNQNKIITRLDEQKCVNLMYEYRLAQVKQTQPKNMWETNNQKMIELMKTKGAGIDSAVREDAGKALKFLEEKASNLTGKHSEIRNKLLQFCVDYGYEYAYEEADSYFFLKIGDFTVQLELCEYLIKDAWYFWSNVEPIYAPLVAKMFHQELWKTAHDSLNLMRKIIPTSITSEEKDLVLRALCCMERDLVRYHKNVESRSHIFALNDILTRTDIYPFSIIMPRSPVEVHKDNKRIHSAIDKFEKVSNVATLQIELSPLERHKFCIQSSLTPLNFWSSPDSYKVGARFVIKFAKPIPIRYSAAKQLESTTSGIISTENYVNVYKCISFQRHGREVLTNLSDFSKTFVMYFDFDQLDMEAKNDTLISGFYIDKASQLISAMYIIKREYILNRLCESTCEKNPDLVEWRYLCVNNNKTPLKIRIADICDGQLCFYFHYRCYLVEARIIIRPSGQVGLGNLKVVHHGHKLDAAYHTVSNYQNLIDEWHMTDPIFLNDSQLSDLNEIIENTWHIPALIEQMIKVIKNRCVDNDKNIVHEFRPVFFSDRSYKKSLPYFSKSSQSVKQIVKKKKKGKEPCKRNSLKKNKDNDEDDPPERKEKSNPNIKSIGNKMLLKNEGVSTSRKTQGTTTNAAADGRKKACKKSRSKKGMKRKLDNKRNRNSFRKRVRQYFSNNIKTVLKYYKKIHLQTWHKNQIGINKVLNPIMERNDSFKRSNVFRRFEIRKQHNLRQIKKSLSIQSSGHHYKRRSLLKGRKINQLGSAWKDFVSKVNGNVARISKFHPTLLTWPMLADQRVTHRYRNNYLEAKNDPQMDEAGRVEEWDEYFNVSDCEGNEHVCSYSYIPRKIVPPLSRKFRSSSLTINQIIGRLKPQVRKHLAKFKLKELAKEENEKKLKEMNAIECGEKWSQKEFMQIYKNVKAKKWKNKQIHLNHFARPTAFKLISVINRKKLKQQGIFPYKVLRHAAICLKYGPYRGEPKQHALPKSLTERYRRRIPSSQTQKTRKKIKEDVKQITEKTQHHNANCNQDERVERPTSINTKKNLKSNTSTNQRTRKIPRLKLKPLNLPESNPLPPMTLAQIEDHKRVILYFDQKLQKQDEEVYIEEIRSRLMAIWIYFKPYISTAREFERMLEVYGPEAIYNQLQFHRKNLEIEKQKKEQEKEFQRKQQYPVQQNACPFPTLTSHSGQNQAEKSAPLSEFQNHNNSTRLQNSNTNAVYEAQNMCYYKSQDIFGESSSSSAVSTPSSAGPLQSPFATTGKRRGRGRKANFGTHITDQQLMGSAHEQFMNNELQKAKRGRPRKNPVMTPPSSSSFGSSQESPLFRPQMLQSPFQHSSKLSYSSTVTASTHQNQLKQTQQLALPPQSVANLRPSAPTMQPSPLAVQNTTPHKVMPQYPVTGITASKAHQDYLTYESSSDEETDPPPPRPMPINPQREPLKLKVDINKSIVKPAEAKTTNTPTRHIPLTVLPASGIEKYDEESNAKKSTAEKEQKDKPKNEESRKEKEIEHEKQKEFEKFKEIIAQETTKEKEIDKEKTKEKDQKEKKNGDTIKLTKLKEKESHKSRMKDRDEDTLRIKTKKVSIIPEAEIKEDMPPPAKKPKKLKSPEPLTTRSEKDKKSKEKRQKEKDKERAKQLAEYEEERARKKRRADLRAAKEKDDKEKFEKFEKTEKFKASKIEADIEIHRKKEKKEKRKTEREKYEKADKEKFKKREEKEKQKPNKTEEKEKFHSPSVSFGLGTLKKRRRSTLLNSDEEEARDLPNTLLLQLHRSPSKVLKLNTTDRSKIVAEQLALKKKQKEIETAKLEKEKKRLGITPDLEPQSKNFKETAENETTAPPEKIVMVQFFPEPGVLLEIPFGMVKTLHSMKSILGESKNPESAQKMIDRAKQRCLDNASIPHIELSNILDDITKLANALETAQSKQKQVEVTASAIPAMSAAASAGVSKEEAEKLAAEKEANLKTTQLRIQQAKAIKEKEKKAKMKAAAEAASSIKNPNNGKSPLDSSDVLSRILDTKPPETKKDQIKNKSKDAQASGDETRTAAARAAMAAAEDDAIMQAAVGVPNLGEALKTFKIPKVQESPVEKEEKPEAHEKSKEPEKEKEYEKVKGRDREKECRGDRDRDRDDESERDRDRDRDREKERDRRYNDNFHGRRYSSDYDRKYDSDRRFSSEGKYSEDRRYDDYPHEYHRDDYSNNRGYHHQDRRGGGYQHRKHPRSPRNDSYDRRGGHYHSSRGRGVTYRGRGNFRDTSRDQWKSTGSSSNQHEDFYEGLPPKQAQINREALDDSDYQHKESQRYRHSSFEPNTISLPSSAFPNPPTRKVLLPNRVGGDGNVRSSVWNQPTYFNQPPLPTTGPSASLLSGPPVTNKSSSGYPANTNVIPLSSNTSIDRQSAERRPSRPRVSRDSPPEVGLQIDESD